jgi:hypothetical protein
MDEMVHKERFKRGGALSFKDLPVAEGHFPITGEMFVGRPRERLACGLCQSVECRDDIRRTLHLKRHRAAHLERIDVDNIRHKARERRHVVRRRPSGVDFACGVQSNLSNGTRSSIFRVVASARTNSPRNNSFIESLFIFYFCFYFFEFVLHLHQAVFAQLDQLPRFADLYERFLKIDLLLLLKPIRDPLDVLQIFF